MLAEGGPMPQSLAQIYLHIIFSTKDREPLLMDKVFRDGFTPTWLGPANSPKALL